MDFRVKQFGVGTWRFCPISLEYMENDVTCNSTDSKRAHWILEPLNYNGDSGFRIKNAYFN